MLCSLCWCLFTFVLMCFFVHVFLLWWIIFFSADFCFSSDWSCSASFVFSPSLFFFLFSFLLLLLLLLLHLFFCCFFFFFFFFLFLAPLFCGANCDGGVLPGCSGVCSVVLCFWDRPSRMDIRRQKRKSCALFLGTFAFDAFCQKKPSPPRVWGFVSAVPLHKSAIYRLVLQPLKRKCARETLQK